MIPFLEDMIEPWLRKKYPKVDGWFLARGETLKKNLKLIALICLFVGCYRAWVFEHNNAQMAMYGKDGKSEAWAKYNECDKERAVNDTLAKSCVGNLSYQQSRNDAQQDLFNRCLLAIGLKAAKSRVINTRVVVLKNAGKDEKNPAISYSAAIMMALTSEPMAHVRGTVKCDRTVHLIQAEIAKGGGQKPGIGGIAHVVMAHNYQIDERNIAIDIQQPSWEPTDPLVVLLYGEGIAENSCYLEVP
jgi:hypothetical protein